METSSGRPRRALALAVVTLLALLSAGCGGDSGPTPRRTLGSGTLGNGGRRLSRPMDTRSLATARPPAKSIPARFVDVRSSSEEAPADQPPAAPGGTENGDGG
ncbi:MAG: hypothetical protein GX591_03000 [Planctomycetes bacterium]|nr:hypothetical protein [Planctomycetota bacterium]